jgi:hypothetical protein
MKTNILDRNNLLHTPSRENERREAAKFHTTTDSEGNPG